jgi:hypothetical protein
MTRQTLIIAILPAAFGIEAACIPDSPEMGDIGPSSMVVCRQLEHQFPGAAIAVEGRSIHSPTRVSVAASVDGKPIELHYELSDYSWLLGESNARVADAPSARTGLSLGQ